MARVLMLCHDQHLDRRVIAQAQTLIEHGHSIRLLALSFDPASSEEETAEGIQLTRIGLSHIIPENRIYTSYMARQHALNNLLNRTANRYPAATPGLQRGFQVGSRVNWETYRALLLMKYRNRRMHDPLPFRQAFFSHGEKFVSDVVHVHDLPALEAGVQLATQWRVPLVYDAHELYPEQRAFSRQQRRICFDAESRLIKKANLVFAVNHSIAQEMSKRYGIAEPEVLLNAVDRPDTFDQFGPFDLLRSKLGLSPGRKILLFQGGYSRNRNLENLIEAFCFVLTDDVDLVMLGFGDLEDELKRLAEARGLLGRRVFFLPAVPQSELLQHSASADMGIIPYPHVDLNSFYCTPNKLFEFIQAELPILANDSPELNRFVSANGFGLTQSMTSPVTIADAIDRAFFLSHSDASDWKRALAAKRAGLTWKAQATRFYEAYQSVLGRGLST